jgi:exportin-2 (importin alpha re-exporter)
MGMIQTYSNDANAIKIIFSSTLLICKIFRSLNSQDFPEEFENNMQTWMTHFLSLLAYDNPLLKSQSEEAGLIEQVKSQICDNISLFAQNYGEDFADYLPKFVMSVWELLITTSLETKYDLVILILNTSPLLKLKKTKFFVIHIACQQCHPVHHCCCPQTSIQESIRE